MAVLLCLEKEYGARCEKDIERLECLTFIIFDGYPAVFLTELGIGRNPERIVVGVFLYVIPLFIVVWFWEKELRLALLRFQIDKPNACAVGDEEGIFLGIECGHGWAAKCPTVCFLESADVILHDASFESCWGVEIGVHCVKSSALVGYMERSHIDDIGEQSYFLAVLSVNHGNGACFWFIFSEVAIAGICYEDGGIGDNNAFGRGTDVDVLRLELERCWVELFDSVIEECDISDGIVKYCNALWFFAYGKFDASGRNAVINLYFFDGAGFCDGNEDVLIPSDDVIAGVAEPQSFVLQCKVIIDHGVGFIVIARQGRIVHAE